MAFDGNPIDVSTVINVVVTGSRELESIERDGMNDVPGAVC